MKTKLIMGLVSIIIGLILAIAIILQKPAEPPPTPATVPRPVTVVLPASPPKTTQEQYNTALSILEKEETKLKELKKAMEENDPELKRFNESMDFIHASRDDLKEDENNRIEDVLNGERFDTDAALPVGADHNNRFAKAYLDQFPHVIKARAEVKKLRENM